MVTIVRGTANVGAIVNYEMIGPGGDTIGEYTAAPVADVRLKGRLGGLAIIGAVRPAWIEGEVREEREIRRKKE